MIHHINRMKDKKSYDHIKICRKSIWQNPVPIYDKNSQQSGNRGNIHQHNKDHIKKSILIELLF